MVFLADAALALELMALVAATALLLWAKKYEGACKAFSMVVAYVAMAAAVLALLCTSYYSLRYWEDGWFQRPAAMSRGMGGGGVGMGMGGGKRCPMMEGDGKKCPMMEKKMKMMQGDMEHPHEEGAEHGETSSPGSDD